MSGSTLVLLLLVGGCVLAVRGATADCSASSAAPDAEWRSIRAHIEAGEEIDLEHLADAFAHANRAALQDGPGSDDARDHERVMEWVLVAWRVARHAGGEAPSPERVAHLLGHPAVTVRRGALRYMASDETYVPDRVVRQRIAADPELSRYNEALLLLRR